MLQLEQMIDAAIAVGVSLLIKCIPGLRIEPGTPHTESSDSTTELLQNATPVLTIQLYSKHTTCKAALNKLVFSVKPLYHSAPISIRCYN